PRSRPRADRRDGELSAGRRLDRRAVRAATLFGRPHGHRRRRMSLRILITNDDGVDAPGIAVMEEIAREISDDVWIVAPDGNQSGAAHRFTFGRELELVERRSRVFAVPHGSPADC